MNLRQSFCAFAYLLVACAACSAQMPVIELSAVSPNVGKAGTELDFRVASGQRIDEVTAMRFSHPGIVATLKTADPLPFNTEREPQFGSFRVRIAGDVPPGRYEVRAKGRHGISNPRSFLVHSVANELHVSPSHQRDAPTPLAFDTLVHTNATASEADYFQLAVNDGQTLRVDLIASRMDSRMIGQLELIDESGKIIRSVHGSDEWDPHLVILIHRTGTLTLAVYDTVFRGGAEYPYQLVVRDSENAKALVSDRDSQQRFPRLAGDYSSLIAQAARIEETSDAQTIEVPAKLSAEFDSPDDVDTYEFKAAKGDVFVFDVVSQRMGEPTDARLLVESMHPQQSGDPQWRQEATADDSQNITSAALRLFTQDPQLTFKTPRAATYRVSIRDSDTGTSLSQKQRYWLDVRKPNPGFDLIAFREYPNRDVKQHRQRGSSLRRGGCEQVRVVAVRRDGWKGAIDVNVRGLPAGVTCPPATIAANRNSVALVLSANDAAPHGVAELSVTGKGKVGLAEKTVDAQFATTLWGHSGQRTFHRMRKTDGLHVAVSEADQSPITFLIGDGKVLELKKGGEIKVPVKLTRRDGGKSDCIVRTRDLPPNMTSGDVTIGKDKTDGTLVIKAKPNIAQGTYSLWLQSETKIKLKPNPQAMTRAKAYRDKLQKLHDDPANKDKLETIKAAIATADQRVGAAKAGANDQELTVFLPSPHFSIRVVE